MSRENCLRLCTFVRNNGTLGQCHDAFDVWINVTNDVRQTVKSQRLLRVLLCLCDKVRCKNLPLSEFSVSSFFSFCLSGQSERAIAKMVTLDPRKLDLLNRWKRKDESIYHDQVNHLLQDSQHRGDTSAPNRGIVATHRIHWHRGVQQIDNSWGTIYCDRCSYTCEKDR